MSSDGRGIVSLQQDITDAGWHQGSLLPPTSLSFACNDIEEDAGSKRIVVKVDRISSQSKLNASRVIMRQGFGASGRDG